MLLDDTLILTWRSRSFCGGEPSSSAAGDRFSHELRSGAHYRSFSQMGRWLNSASGRELLEARFADMGTAYLRQVMTRESFARRIFAVRGEPIETPVEVPITENELRSSINPAWVRRLQQQDEEE